MKIEAEDGVIQLWAKECGKSPEGGRGKKQVLSGTQTGRYFNFSPIRLALQSDLQNYS